MTISKKVRQFQHSLKTVFNHRMLTILLLGFSSGLPLALTGSSLQAWYTVSGVPIVTIGLLTLVGQPYAFKFLWAPILDRFVPPFLGRRLGWIAIAQIALFVLLVIMAFGKPGTQPVWMAMLALGVAFFSATQDIAIDAYRTDILVSDAVDDVQHDTRESVKDIRLNAEVDAAVSFSADASASVTLPSADEKTTTTLLGMGAALNTIGYRFAMLLSGGLAMVLADYMGWKITYLTMACILGLNFIVTYFAPSIKGKVYHPLRLSHAIVEPFREFLSRDTALALLFLIVLYRLTDAFALSLSTAFLLRGVGFSLTDVGAIYKVVGFFATLLGTLSGGVWMLKLSTYRSLLWFGLLQGVSVLPFMLLAIVGKQYGLMVLAIFLESFCGGLASVAFVAFLMKLCDKRYTATQFALFTSLSAIGRIFVGPIAGMIVAAFGWTLFFFFSFLMVFPALGLLLWLKSKAGCFADQKLHGAVQA